MSRDPGDRDRRIQVKRFGSDDEEQLPSLDLPCSLCGRQDLPVTLVFNGTQQAAICEQCLGEDGAPET